jgi:hypothetical protein
MDQLFQNIKIFNCYLKIIRHIYDKLYIIILYHTMSQDRTSKPEIPPANHLLLSTARYESQDEKRDQSLNNLGQLLVCPPTRITRKNPKKPRRENMSQETHSQSMHRAEGKSIPVVKNGRISTKNDKTSSSEYKHKILIVGDSHTRNCAREVKQIVANKFEVYGIIKPYCYYVS